MSREALDNIILHQLSLEDDLTPEERIKRAIDIALALLDISIASHS